MRRLCRIIGGAMPLGLGDAEVADEVYHAMMVGCGSNAWDNSIVS